MATRLFLLLALVCLVGAALPAIADRDIVYSARYYLTPGSKGHSHFHLYRINPDGAGRTQITFGKHDDQYPAWSPDGRWVAFVRDNRSLCVTSAIGGKAKVLLTSDPNSTNPHAVYYDLQSVVWWPDSRRIVVFTDLAGDAAGLVINALSGKQESSLADAYGLAIAPDGKHAFFQGDKDASRIVEIVGANYRTVSHVSGNWQSAPEQVAWVDDRNAVAICTPREDSSIFLCTYNFQATGSPFERIACEWPASKLDPYKDSVDPGNRSLLAGPPGTEGLVLYVQDVGNSTTRPDNDYWLASSRTGEMKQIGTGQFLIWSPDGQHFCITPPHDGEPYGLKNGRPRYLDTASLQIGSRNSSRLRTITPGMVYVTGADWRRSR